MKRAVLLVTLGFVALLAPDASAGITKERHLTKTQARAETYRVLAKEVRRAGAIASTVHDCERRGNSKVRCRVSYWTGPYGADSRLLHIRARVRVFFAAKGYMLAHRWWLE